MSAGSLKGDHRLLKAREVTLEEIEQEGPFAVLANSGCGQRQSQHDWSKCQEDVRGEDAYQFCIDCGRVRRAPSWFTRTKR